MGGNTAISGGSGGVVAAWPVGWLRRFGWHWVVGIVCLLATSIAVAAPATVGDRASATAGSGETANVVVMATTGVREAVDAVRSVGGEVTRRLGIIKGVAATVPVEQLGLLAGQPGIIGVADDRHMAPSSVVPSLGYDPDADFGSMSEITRLTGAQAAWAAGYTGTGIDVALIDTGVAPVPGRGTTINGPDLSFDYQTGMPASIDSYGHGTHLAGIINGRSMATPTPSPCATCLNSSGWSDTTQFVGMAPGARVVNVKVGSFDGGADVSQVIAAIDWVVKNKTANGMKIKVISLSFGSLSTNAYTKDPLAYATEVARTKGGLLVVAAAGNDGATRVGLDDPAYDPFNLAVGAEDPMGTTTLVDDTIASWSGRGTTARPVDVVAPGTHVISLRVPGSFIDVNYGSTALVGTNYFRGTGTSQAAAVVAGLAALVYQKYPSATPDQVKKLILNTSTALTSSSALATPTAAGKGLPNAGRAVTTALPSTTSSKQAWTAGTGTGLLENTRGGSHVITNGVELTGERSLFYNTAWSSSTWAKKSVGLTSWSLGLFLGQRWTGDAWSGTNYVNARWTLNDWTGATWASHVPSAETWDGTAWSGTWSGAPWVGHRWRDNTWSSYYWG